MIKNSPELFEMQFDEEEVDDEFWLQQLAEEGQAKLPTTAYDIARASNRDLLLSKVRKFVMLEWPEKCHGKGLQAYCIKERNFLYLMVA